MNNQDSMPATVPEPEVEPGFSPKPQSTEDPLWMLDDPGSSPSPNASPSPSPRPSGEG